MKKIIIFFLVTLFLGIVFQKNNIVHGQDLVKEVYVKEHIPNKDPVPYPYVREADVMWGKTVWRILDLREKMNFPLYFPTQPIGNRMSLIDVLIYAVENENLTAYSATDDLNEFKQIISLADVNSTLDKGFDTVQVRNLDTQLLEDTVIARPAKTDEVKQIMIKEKWFFDRKHSTMQVQIVGMCPIRMYYRDEEVGLEDATIQKKKTFWVYYPEVRDVLSSHEIYNRNNDAQRISFDDFFMQRRFSSYIFAESNVYNNRSIMNYAPGRESLLESEKIKEYLFNMEHDLWEY